MEHDGRGLTATGTQLGSVYELRYRLAPCRRSLELVGERSLEVELIRFTAGNFTSKIRFDEAGFVLDYPQIGTRVWVGWQAARPARDTNPHHASFS